MKARAQRRVVNYLSQWKNVLPGKSLKTCSTWICMKVVLYEYFFIENKALRAQFNNNSLQESNWSYPILFLLKMTYSIYTQRHTQKNLSCNFIETEVKRDWGEALCEHLTRTKWWYGRGNLSLFLHVPFPNSHLVPPPAELLLTSKWGPWGSRARWEFGPACIIFVLSYS